MRSGASALPLAVVGAVAVTGFAVSWMLGSLIDPDPTDFCGMQVPEGASFRMEPRWWPPGTASCVIETSDGVVSRLHVPWLEWLTVALLAASCGFATSALVAPRGRLLTAAAAPILFLAAFVVFFSW